MHTNRSLKRFIKRKKYYYLLRNFHFYEEKNLLKNIKNYICIDKLTF